MAEQKKTKIQTKRIRKGITCITVGGFKSISQEQKIEIRPLTILAGANSSGKSSIMQPLLLLKQTLEAPYDPGALLLNGTHVLFTSANQLLSHTSKAKTARGFHIGIELESEFTLTIYFTRGKNKRLDVEQTIYDSNKRKYRFYIGMEQDEILPVIPEALKKLTSEIEANFKLAMEESRHSDEKPNIRFVIIRNRCFLTTALCIEDRPIIPSPLTDDALVGTHIRQMIHLPGLRGSPERTYHTTAVGPTFPGTFESYVASVIEQWQIDGDTERLEKLYNYLARLALTRKVKARRMNDTQIELLVNRLPSSDKEDMVNIADVGLGVSQALPVLVALQTAKPGQLIYIEQPEIHLHPRAQYSMAEVLADAALEGKRLVVETHSSLLLLGIQTLVAEGKLPPEMVKLHWFTLQEDGSTKIDSTDLDERGAYGDWAEDFDDTALYSEDRFLNAQTRLRGRTGE